METLTYIVLNLQGMITYKIKLILMSHLQKNSLSMCFLLQKFYLKIILRNCLKKLIHKSNKTNKIKKLFLIKNKLQLLEEKVLNILISYYKKSKNNLHNQINQKHHKIHLTKQTPRPQLNKNAFLI